MGETLKSLLLAVSLAALLGPLLGRLATQWFSGRGLSNLLTELRGALLPFVGVLLLVQETTFPPWVAIGLVVGVSQAIAVGRWMARRSGEWAPALLGGIALGRSYAALLSARAQARGAVVGTLGTTVVHLILLEAILAALFPTREFGTSLGASLMLHPDENAVLSLFVCGLCVLLTETVGSFVLQGRRRF